MAGRIVIAGRHPPSQPTAAQDRRNDAGARGGTGNAVASGTMTNPSKPTVASLHLNAQNLGAEEAAVESALVGVQECAAQLESGSADVRALVAAAVASLAAALKMATAETARAERAYSAATR